MPTTATNITLSTSAQVCALSQVSTGTGNRKCRVRVWYSNLNTSGSNITMTVNVEWRWMTGTSGYYASGNKVTGYVQNSSGTQLCSASVAGFTTWPTSWSTYGSTSFTLSYPGTYSNTWKIQMGFESSSGYISGSGDIVQPTITAPTYRRVSFNANGHGTAPAAFWVAHNTVATAPTAPTASGYTFDGWYTNEACTTAYNWSSAVTADITLYARWKSTRDLTFKSGSNGATSSTVTQTYYNDVAQAVSFPAPASYSGYTALGWRDDTSAGAKEYGGASATNVTYTGSATTLYAVYSKSATYYSGTNKASSGTGTVYYNSYNRWGHSAFTQTAIDGWTSLGFRNDTTASGREYTAAAQTNLTSDPGDTFYAVYSKSATVYSGISKETTGSGTIYYNTNNSWGHSAFTAITTITSWTNLGYRNDTTAGAKEYNVAAQTGLTADPGITFYAVYNRTITITYAANGGSGTMSNTTGTQYYNTNGSLSPTGLALATNGFTRTGYSFTGWDLGAVGTTVSFGVSDTTVTKTATAQWSVNSYTLTINPNGGTYNNSTSNTTVTQNYGTTYTLLRPTRPGYVFSRWTANVACGCTEITPAIGIYNNSNNGTVTHSWVTDSSAGTNMNVLQITTNGTASPGAGGFVQSITSQASHTYIHVIYAKIPTGYNITFAANATGDNRIQRWLTPTAGTGSYKVYVSKLIAGATGTFSTFGHMYITGSNNTSVTWYVAASYIYDFTAGAFKSNIKGNYNFGSVASNVTLTAQWDKHRTARIIESGTAYSSIPRYPYVWNGSTFKQGWLYVWDGSKWVEGEWDKIK